MSYNITSSKVKKVKDLKIPLKSFFKHERKDFHPDKELSDDFKTVTLRFMDAETSGKVQDDNLIVEDLSLHGDGSGTFLEYVLELALKDSTGSLRAAFVWEGGDSINELFVEDGKLTWNDINL